MKVPILDLKGQIKPIRKEINAAIKQVIDKANFVFGAEVEELEKEISSYTGSRFAVAVSNGTDAIKLSLAALGIKCGDKVICPAFTYYATAGAIAGMGAVPLFVDINPQTYNISCEDAKNLLKRQKGKKAKAIIPVHLFGQCADMHKIISLSREYNLKVVEDTAQAFGAEYKGKKAGTLGDCGAVSFFPGKNLGAFGDAGMILTNNKATALKIKLFRNQGNLKKYHHLVIGYNNRMDTLQAAVLRIKLKYLDGWNKRRQQNAAYFNQQFAGLNLKTPFVADFSTHIYHQYVLRLPSDTSSLIKHLKDKGIDARVYYPIPLHLQPCFKYLGYKRGDFPESEKAAQQTLAIPVYPDLAKKELNYIVSSIKEFVEC